MTLKEQLNAKRNELADLKSKIKAGDAEAIKSGMTLMDEIASLSKQVEEADQKNALLLVIGNADEGKGDELGQPKAAKNLGEHFVNFVKGAQHEKRFDLSAPAFVKSSTDTQTSPSGAVDWATTFDKNVVEAARTPLVIRDLFGAERISGSTLQFLVEGAIEGAPAATNEAAEKPQVHFAAPTPKTVTLSKIACHIKESDEYINDYPFLADAINGRLIYQLGLVEQNTLVSALTGTSGIQTDSSTWGTSSTANDIAELILDAAMDVQEQSGFPADAIVMNPATWYTLRVAKNTANDYYGGGFFGAQNIPNLWGIPVCVTTAVSATQIIVGAFKTCGSVVSRDGISVEAVNTNEDDFVKNLMTIRAEERLALAVRRPKGFKLLTKNS